MNRFVLFSLCYFALLQAAAAEDEPSESLDVVEVVDVAPLSGSGIEKKKVAANIQTADAEQLEKAQSLSLSEYMNRHLGSVHVNEAQNNPLQPDIYYRGFVASPLLGLPQGLSTYVNGVRFNEPFGDTVNWDLIPRGAIDSMELYPGSNPLYGLNSLGGAISLKTKTGFSAPRHQFEAYGGSWDRHAEELSSGWNNGTFGYFIDLNHFDERGWRNFSPTEANRVFGTLSWRNDRANLDLTLGANDNDMRGNGAAPVQLLDENREAVYTHPDQTITRMFFSELAGSYALSDRVELSGNAYYRQNRIRTFNGDDSDYEACNDGDPNSLLCNEDGEPALDIFGNPVAADRPNVEGGTRNTSATYNRSRGGNLQAMFDHDWFGHKNNLLLGGSYDYADVHFGSDTELASLTPDRGTTGSGILIADNRVRLSTVTETYGFYLSDSFSITDKLTATLAGRYNHISITMKNRYLGQDGEDKLSGKHSYERFNPSAGLTYQIFDDLGVYGSYGESSRVPTPMELSCADPGDPCRLPNAFVSDPPLDQVVAKTWEGGLRGDFNRLIGKGDTKWNLGYFNSTNHDDIIFRRNGDSISEGFFSNVGQTRRYGFEAGINSLIPALFSPIDDWTFSANYTYLNARYLDGFVIQNPLNNAVAATVERGDKIPGIPEHIFKASAGVSLWQRLSLAVDGLYSSDQFFRGDEANLTGQLQGYWLFNARAEYKFNRHFTVFGKLDNLFDTHYGTFGTFGNPGEVLGDRFNDPRFVSPGAPRAGWVGIRITL